MVSLEDSFAYEESIDQGDEGGSNQTQPLLDFEAMAKYFLGFWNANNAVAGKEAFEYEESKKHLRVLHKTFGHWCPPPEVVRALTKHRKPPATPLTSKLPDNKNVANLKFILKILGCCLRENTSYKEFLSAHTLRQKRHWMFKYMFPKYPVKPNYAEPICSTRLKRLHRFFPDRFTNRGGDMYFNDKILTFDGNKKFFYFGVQPNE